MRRPDVRLFSGRDQAMMTSFRVKKTPPLAPEGATSYQIPTLFPKLGTPIESFKRRVHRKEPNVKVGREAMNETLSAFLTDAERMGLEVGQHDPAVKLLRVAGVGVGESKENPKLQPAYARIRIKDEKGNDVVFNMTYDIGYQDGKGREWDRITIRLDEATMRGEHVEVTPEMHGAGFVMLSHNMPEILTQAQQGVESRATIRQESPCSLCFNDGHRASAGKIELGCTCQQERAESLDTVYDRGGIVALMPASGNGNGSFAQDIQVGTRGSAARRGEEMLPFQQIYGRMGKKEDARGTALHISTFILEHLFQMQNVPNITVLSSSTKKGAVWGRFSDAHSQEENIILEGLGSDQHIGPDHDHKRTRREYRPQDSGASALPLMPT